MGTTRSLRWGLVLQCTLLHMAAVVVAEQDPCVDNINWGNEKRSISYMYNALEDECISDFEGDPTKWYRFPSSTGSEIVELPTDEFPVPKQNQCGTITPIFIKSKTGASYHDEAISVSPATVQAPVCAGELIECLWNEEITIKHCNEDPANPFFVYKLQGTLLNSAYCVGTRKPCETGTIWNDDLNACITTPPPGFDYDANSQMYYKLVLEGLEFEAARDACQALHPKSFLAVITDKDENDAILDHIRSYSPDEIEMCSDKQPGGVAPLAFYTSGQRILPGNCGSQFVWKPHSTSEIPLTFSDWSWNQPDCMGITGCEQVHESCIQLNQGSGYQWNDICCEWPACPICQYAPEIHEQ